MFKYKSLFTKIIRFKVYSGTHTFLCNIKLGPVIALIYTFVNEFENLIK